MALKGADRHKRRLKKLSGEAVIRIATAVVHEGADIIKAEAQRLITTGSVSGKSHKPSRAETPPNNDTGVLASHIFVRQKKPLNAQVRSEAVYARIQEFGGTIQHPGGTPYFMRDGKPVFVSNSGAGAFHGLPKTKPHEIVLPSRPYLRPARDAKRAEIQKKLIENMNKLVKAS